VTRLQDLPIRRKLTAITVPSAGIALLLACAAFVGYDLLSFRAEMVLRLSTQAQIVGRLSTSALVFRDPDSATATLAALSADTHVVSAGLYDAAGALFASYRRDPGSAQPPLPDSASGGAEGHVFGPLSLVLFRTVEFDGAPVGTLLIESDLAEMTTRLKRYGAIALAVLVVSILLAQGIASQLQGVLTRPVLHLVETAKAVSARKDYSARAVAAGSDELGLLTRTFNEMLDQIQTHEAALRKSEASLRDSEQRLQAILESATAVVCVKDVEGRYLLVNRRFEEVFHLKRQDVVGKTDHDVFPKPMADVVRANDQRVINGRAPIQVEELAPHDDGVHTYISSKVPLFNRDGVPYALCGISTDITESKRLEEARWCGKELEEQSRRDREASRLKSEFLANMSHELRTPLNAIIGFAELMHDGKLGPVSAQHQEFLGDILTSSRHLLQLINDVLDLSKVESGKMEFQPATIEPGKLVGEVRDILRTLAAQKRIRVETEVDASLNPLFADPGKLKQVLYNYLSNALKFTPDEGRIVVRLRPEAEQRFRLEVEDTGIGIRPEDQDRLFTEFQQLDGGVARNHQGTGLGLALCKRIVEAQGGFVGVQSTPGVGSVFFAVLPRTAREPEIAQAPHLEQRLGTPIVLVVEDDSKDRAWLARTLGEAGYSVETVATGGEAVGRGQQARYDAITLDLLLPDMSGWDVLRALRTQGPNQDTPVIVVSVVAEKIAAEFPVHDFLTKPVESHELLGALRRTGLAPNGARPILVVDDDPAALKLMRTELQQLGYRSVLASEGEAALRAAAADPPALVVLDLLMPGMNGFEFLNRFRRSPEGRRVPVIVWTVADLTDEVRQRLAASATGVVLKGNGGTGALLAELERYAPRRSASGAKGAQSDGR